MLLSTFINLRELYHQAWLDKCQDKIGTKTKLYNISAMWNTIQDTCYIQCNSSIGIVTFEIKNEQILKINGIDQGG